MIKNDINLIQKRKTNQYSSKSVVLIIAVVVILGAGIYFGITLPSKNLTATKAALLSLDNDLQQYNSTTTEVAEDGTQNTVSVTIDAAYIEKSNILNSLNEQLDSLTLLATAESNALVYINSIESAIPTKVNISNLKMSEDELNIYGAASSDAALAEFTVKLRESGYFQDIFITSSMVSTPGDTRCVFNITATLLEPLNKRPLDQTDTTEANSTSSNTEGNQ